MKQLKKTLMSLIVGLCILFTVPSVLPETASIQTVQAASKVKLNKSKSTLIKGQTLQLKLSGTTKKITWSTSSKSVATVSSKGKVTAKKAGTATITAKAGGKKYTCKVTVESPKISKTSVSLTEKKTTTLKVTGTKQTVKWNTKNKSIATVNSKGVVTAKKAGTTTITATVGGKKYTCKVTVKNVAVTKVNLNKTTLELTEGDTSKLKATVSPSNATDKNVTWSSSNSAVVSVSGGTVTAKSAGKATITAKAGSKKATCKVTVKEKEIAVTGITLDKTTLELTEGDTANLTATVTPANATNKSVTWSSSDSSVAAVSNGTVTAKSAGKATITATAGNKKATCKVTVKEKEIAVTGISLDKSTLELTEDETVILTATVTPSNATNKEIVWSSSNDYVATVDDGLVKANFAGTTLITATAGNKKATCKVTVKEKEIAVTGITLDKSVLELTEGDAATLTATVTPSNATEKTITWSSSNNNVATVDIDGNVTGIAAGTTEITASINGYKYNCIVTVNSFLSQFNDKEIMAGYSAVLLNNSLKNPASLQMYKIYYGIGNMFANKQEKEVVMIDYSGENSYGGTSRDMAMFWKINSISTVKPSIMTENGDYIQLSDAGDYHPSDLANLEILENERITAIMNYMLSKGIG